MRVCVYECVCMSVCACVRACVRARVCVCVCARALVSVSVCMCLWEFYYIFCGFIYYGSHCPDVLLLVFTVSSPAFQRSVHYA